MAPSKATMLSTLIDISSEDDFGRSDVEMMPTPDSQPENKPLAKRRAGKTKGAVAAVAAKVSKTKAVSRRISNGNAGTKTKARKVLAERTNAPNDGNETEEVDDFEEEMESAPAKPARRVKTSKVSKDEEAPVKVRKAAPLKASTTTQKKAGRSKQAVQERVIPDTQPDPMDLEPTEVEDITIDEPEPRRQRPARQPLAPQLTSRARSTSRQPDPYARHRRAGSASDTERAGEPALRRKLGEITRKFENLELKYKNLKELGSNESQSNFDKLKKSSDQKARDQDEIIASLKKELATQKALTTEARPLRSQNATLLADNQRLTTENKTLASTLSSSQNEVKTLQIKLASSRNNMSTDTSSNNKTVPGSTTKPRPGSAAAIKKEDDANLRMKTLQLKEELYSDLTGLMIHNVKRMEEEDVYDCIQTGRNGTLRFHLSVSHMDKATATPGTSYDEEEFVYAPLFDEKNDRQLLEILPDYLTEEIAFPRPSAAKFYLKIMDCMSKRYADE